MVDMIGRTFGRLTVLRKSDDEFQKGCCIYYLCQCECGNLANVNGHMLRNGHTQSCGCLKRERAGGKPIHGGCKGDSVTRLYRIWSGMKSRCNNPNATGYNLYGGRGITVCDEWQNSFAIFQEWALENGYNDELTIDRINVDGNYEPSNCRWATAKEQARNKRSKITWILSEEDQCKEEERKRMAEERQLMAEEKRQERERAKQERERIAEKEKQERQRAKLERQHIAEERKRIAEEKRRERECAKLERERIKQERECAKQERKRIAEERERIAEGKRQERKRKAEERRCAEEEQKREMEEKRKERERARQERQHIIEEERQRKVEERQRKAEERKRKSPQQIKKEYSDKYYAKNREKILAKRKQRYKENREAEAAYGREWRKKHPDYQREYRAAHKLNDCNTTKDEVKYGEGEKFAKSQNCESKDGG